MTNRIPLDPAEHADNLLHVYLKRIHELEDRLADYEVCCCGEPMQGHSNPYLCGHTPISMMDHTLTCADEHRSRLERALDWALSNLRVGSDLGGLSSSGCKEAIETVSAILNDCCSEYDNGVKS